MEKEGGLDSVAPRLTPTLMGATLAAALAGLLFGFDTAVISGVTEAIQKLFDLSPGEKGFAVASALIGTIMGAMGNGPLGDKLGRRESLKITALLFLVSALGCAFSWDFLSLVFFRWVGGLGIGAASVLAPMYVAEIAPARWRGRLVMVFQLNIVLGILLAYLSNYLVGRAGFGEAEWRWKFGVEALPAVLFFFNLFLIPRSPRWLVKKGRVDQAREVLQKAGEPQVEKALEEILESERAEREGGKEPLFQKRFAFPIFLAVSIAAFNQLTGINALLYYLNSIFEKAGFDKVSSDIQAVVIGGTNLVFTILAMLVIDKIGRKILLLIGAVGMTLCLAGVSWVFFSGTHQGLLLYLLIGFIAFFAFSQGAVIWVYISEVFPNTVRAKGQALGCFTHWVLCAAVSWTFPVLAASSGGYPFLIFALVTAVQFFVVLKFYPETKGVSLEELEKQLVRER